MSQRSEPEASIYSLQQYPVVIPQTVYYCAVYRSSSPEVIMLKMYQVMGYLCAQNPHVMPTVLC